MPFGVSSFTIRGSLPLFALAAAFGLSGCGNVDAKIKRQLGIDSPSVTNDFLKTEIVVGSARADGVSELAVVIHLKNSDNTPVADYKPVYEVTAGLGVLPGGCTTSDKNGVSACALRATQAGTKRLKLKNAKVGLEKEVVFDAAVLSKSGMSLSSGSVRASTGNGYKVKLSLSGQMK